MALFGVARGINFTSIFSLLDSHAPNETRSAFFVARGTPLRTGQTVGPLLMPSLAGTLGATGAYLAATMARAALFLALAVFR